MEPWAEGSHGRLPQYCVGDGQEIELTPIIIYMERCAFSGANVSGAGHRTNLQYLHYGALGFDANRFFLKPEGGFFDEPVGCSWRFLMNTMKVCW